MEKLWNPEALVVNPPATGPGVEVAQVESAPTADEATGGGTLFDDDLLLAASEPVDPVRIEGVEKRYGPVRALDGVSLRIPKGAFVALLGPNGAGKTTLIECLLGLNVPSAGSLHLFGKDIIASPRSVQDRIGVQLQSTHFLPKITLEEYFQLFSGFYKKPVPYKEICEMLGLERYLKKSVRVLSGGWRQRFSLALALINDPDLLFLDEPTTGFDPIVRRQVWGILKDLHKGGRTVLLSTHYLEEAEHLADYIVMLAAGKIVAAGRPESLKQAVGGQGSSLEDLYVRLAEGADHDRA